MKKEFIEKIYSGWLAKIIGIRLGAPIEGWTYEKIQNIYGELDHYPVDYQAFAADDDSNGPFFFLRALEDKKGDHELKAQDVAEALLNYAPFEHGFFWWGGYGISTEHTAYLNLRSGIPAPRSGSIEQNGTAVAEQIGGQIFIDTWGLVTPGNPDMAAKFAREAASVTHDGNGIYGGIFIATCISYAFIEMEIRKIIEKGLSYIPRECEYTRVVRAVMAFYDEHPTDWRLCFEYIHQNFGYDKYPGNCHIIPNTAVIILSLLYGKGDFSGTLNICNMCGWDTDCNVGNVATIMGVRNGLDGIDYDKWRKPINDFLACSSVIGSLNIMDIPFGASYIVKLAYDISKEDIPKPWNTIVSKRIDSCHFEYPGSTHAIRVRVESLDDKFCGTRETAIINTTETAFTGERALKVIAKSVEPGENILVYKKTYYVPEDFHDSRYDPSFSPLVYPGQSVHGSAFLPEYTSEAQVSIFAHEMHSNKVLYGAKVDLKKNEWKELSFTIPQMDGALIDEIGICFHINGEHMQIVDFCAIVDDLYVDGSPQYSIDFSKEKKEVWPRLHCEISQLTKLKGLVYLDGGELNIACSDFAEVYTGRHDWSDYAVQFCITPITGDWHMVNFRVQGAIRSYAFGLLPNNKIAILKNENGYQILKETEFRWEKEKEYFVNVSVIGNSIYVVMNDCKLDVTDTDYPYLKGGIGLSVRNGSHCKCRKITVDRN